jgi:predicted transcriptional regulator
LHLRAICRLMNKEIGVTLHHLEVLETKGLIRSVFHGKFKCFFLPKTVKKQANFEDILTISIRQKRKKKIIQKLYDDPNPLNIKEIGSTSNIKSQTVRYHMTQIIENKIVQYYDKDGHPGYKLTTPARRFLNELCVSNLWFM